MNDEELRDRVLCFEFSFNGLWCDVAGLIAALKALPSDAVIIGIDQDYSRQRVTQIYVASLKFDLVNQACVIPRRSIICTRKEDGTVECRLEMPLKSESPAV